MATNTILNIKTVEAESENGPLIAIMIAADIHDLASADEFVREVAEKFKVHRMCSPPQTSALLITIIGAMSAESFAKRWKDLAASDPILMFNFGQMRIADVVRGTPKGEMLESVSLLFADSGT